jgi:hypothetical protein
VHTEPELPAPLEFEVRNDRALLRRLGREDSRNARRGLLLMGTLLVVSGLSGLVGDGAWVLVGAFTMIWGVLLLLTAVRTLFWSRRSVPRSCFEAVRYRISAEGVEWVSGNGTLTRVPWRALNRLDVRKDRLLLMGDDGCPVRLIARAGLSPKLDDEIQRSIAAGLGGSATIAG